MGSTDVVVPEGATEDDEGCADVASVMLEGEQLTKDEETKTNPVATCTRKENLILGKGCRITGLFIQPAANRCSCSLWS